MSSEGKTRVVHLGRESLKLSVCAYCWALTMREDADRHEATHRAVKEDA